MYERTGKSDATEPSRAPIAQRAVEAATTRQFPPTSMPSAGAKASAMQHSLWLQPYAPLARGPVDLVQNVFLMLSVCLRLARVIRLSWRTKPPHCPMLKTIDAFQLTSKREKPCCHLASVMARPLRVRRRCNGLSCRCGDRRSPTSRLRLHSCRPRKDSRLAEGLEPWLFHLP